MERLRLWFLEGLAEGQGGPQARRREAPPKRTGGPPARRNGGRPAAHNRRLAGWDLRKKGRSLSRLGQRLLARWRAEAFLSRGPDL